MICSSHSIIRVTPRPASKHAITTCTHSRSREIDRQTGLEALTAQPRDRPGTVANGVGQGDFHLLSGKGSFADAAGGGWRISDAQWARGSPHTTVPP